MKVEFRTLALQKFLQEVKGNQPFWSCFLWTHEGRCRKIELSQLWPI